MYTLNVDEARPRLSELIHEASRGEEVVIAREDGTAVRLVPVESQGRPRFGSARGLFTMAADFDAPLEDFAPYER
ncbi:MAG TPA: type II toxin-antitoxin system prevent-host-death family antitoxin [Longimicrobiaceae bacterium]|nr:type II toxin-antitoxin system prevent-host-death family antitoxin [Longimicrobiaceae bacterium]